MGFFDFLDRVGGGHLIVLEGDLATCVRGDVPFRLLSDLADLCDSGVQGRIELRGHGPDLRVRTRGMSEADEQRVRNIIMIYKAQI